MSLLAPSGKYSPLNGVKFCGMLYRLCTIPALGAQSPAKAARKVGGIKPPEADMRKGNAMGRIIKAVVLLVIFGFIGLVGYAYLGDLAPIQGEVTKPVVLNAD